MADHHRRLVSLGILAGFLLCAASACNRNEDKKLEISKDELTLLDLTNEARKRENLPPLKPSPVLFAVARAHSANMAKKGELKHELEDKGPAERVKDAGYDYAAVGENIAAGTEWTLSAVFEAWMKSPEHKANILRDSYEEIGTGIARGEQNQVYYTQVFGKSRKKQQSTGKRP